MSRTVPVWVERALELPLFFAQVREDARQDVELVRQCARGAQVLLVASGGCTAAALAAEPNVARLVLVDPNPSQLALARLKLHLLATQPPGERAALLGHAPHPTRADALAAALRGLGLLPDALGPLARVAALGPDQAGRYEQTFLALRAELDRLGQRPRLDALRTELDPVARAEAVASGSPLGDAIATAFADVFALEILVRLFGEGATRNPARPFHEHFTAQTRAVFSGRFAIENPYLEQVVWGRYPPRVPAPWLALPEPAQLPAIEFRHALMNDALRADDGRYDLIGLSNILDWLSPEEAEETLALAHARLEPGGRVVIRQLNSTLDIPLAGRQLTWLSKLAAELHARDRSFFYRALHIGQR